MLSNEKIYEILVNQGIWEEKNGRKGIKRKGLATICKFIKGKEVIALKGIRRAGKSTLLFQIMDYLLKQKVKERSILYVNFDEPLFVEEQNISLLDKIYEVYREKVNPSKKAFIFLDEIQYIPEWERWVRGRNESERGKVKIFITGSSSRLLSREFSTLLTGRHLSFEVFPLSFKEFLWFKGVKIKDEMDLIRKKRLIKNLLNEYLEYGGFPEVVLAEQRKPKMEWNGSRWISRDGEIVIDKERKIYLLRQYFDDIIYKDIVMRFNVRDVHTLKKLALYYFINAGRLSSFKKISNAFEVSLDVIRHYTSYLKEAYLIEEVPYYSYKMKTRMRNPRKVYPIDWGMRRFITTNFTEDSGFGLETIIFWELKRKGYEIYYWKNKGEVDFIAAGVENKSVAYNVTFANIQEDKRVREREINSILECVKDCKIKKGIILHDGDKELIQKENIKIEILPLWKWLSS